MPKMGAWHERKKLQNGANLWKATLGDDSVDSQRSDAKRLDVWSLFGGGPQSELDGLKSRGGEKRSGGQRKTAPCFRFWKTIQKASNRLGKGRRCLGKKSEIVGRKKEKHPVR